MAIFFWNMVQEEAICANSNRPVPGCGSSATVGFAKESHMLLRTTAVRCMLMLSRAVTECKAGAAVLKFPGNLTQDRTKLSVVEVHIFMFVL